MIDLQEFRNEEFSRREEHLKHAEKQKLYVINNTATDEEIERITITQNDNGIDIEDRIKKLQLLLEQ